MFGSWNTVYEIASKRHHTKRGANHLSEKALYVLNCLVVLEKQEAMASAIRSSGMFVDIE